MVQHVLLCVLVVCTYIVSAQEGNVCTLPSTGQKGTCKTVSNCPSVIQQANNGINPAICGRRRNTLIVCCANDINLQPNDNTFVTDEEDEDDDDIFEPFIFPSSNSRNIAEEKCEEYKRGLITNVAALPLITDAEPVTVNIQKCDYDKIPLIVGGEAASLGEFPHMAAIGWDTEDGMKYMCGGTLISEFYVLTAAHCTITQQYGPPIRVRLGDLDLISTDDGAKPEEVVIEKIIKHPDQKVRQKYNDIALIKLARRIDFNKNIRPACLYTKKRVDQRKAVATGWGRIGQDDDVSSILRKVSLDLFDNAGCSKYYNHPVELPDGIRPTMLCAGDLMGRKDTCQGDSGGPLVITDQKNQCAFYLIGLTSFGKGCANPNAPGIYTRISEYIPWIEKIVWPQ